MLLTHLLRQLAWREDVDRLIREAADAEEAERAARELAEKEAEVVRVDC